MNFYRVLFYLALPALVVYTCARALQDGGYRYFWQRLGLQLPSAQNPLWLHCASVGEVISAGPLLELIIKSHGEIAIVVTTNTPTGARVLTKNFGDKLTHVYLPLDFRGGIRRFLKHVNPRCALIFETELWPELFHQCHTLNLPLFILNGRLSKRTLQAPAFVRALYAQTLNHVEGILARSDEDKDGFIALGAHPDRVITLGNMKFARPENWSPERLADPIGRTYWLAASTHEDEEMRVAQTWKKVRSNDQLLVIAPRYPKRGTSVSKQLTAMGWQVSLRSRNEPITAATQIYVADTIGEMPAFMQHAQFVFMGGSLINRGGHNILEPAQFGKAVVVGPYISNFSAEVQALVEHDAILEVQDEEVLADTIKTLLANEQLRTLIGVRAEAFTRANAGMAHIYLLALEELKAFSA
jgi:3-deoxy-D-manno-octulosonic-acid transferase